MSLAGPSGWVRLRCCEMKRWSSSTAWWSESLGSAAARRQNITGQVTLEHFSSRSYLPPPESQPLYEVCYYSSYSTVRRHLNATPRTSIQSALSSPYYYLQVRLPVVVKCDTVILQKKPWSDSKISVFESTEHFIPLHSSFFQNESLKTEDGTVSNSAPDICIAYKLHLECGRLINLYDWLEVSPFVKWWCWGCAAPSELSPEQLCKLESLLSHNHRRPYWSWRINVSHDWPTVDRSLLSSRPILLLFRLQRETIRILKTPGKLTKSSSILQSASFLILLAPPCAC